MLLHIFATSIHINCWLYFISIYFTVTVHCGLYESETKLHRHHLGPALILFNLLLYNIKGLGITELQSLPVRCNLRQDSFRLWLRNLWSLDFPVHVCCRTFKLPACWKSQAVFRTIHVRHTAYFINDWYGIRSQQFVLYAQTSSNSG